MINVKNQIEKELTESTIEEICIVISKLDLHINEKYFLRRYLLYTKFYPFLSEIEIPIILNSAISLSC